MIYIVRDPVHVAASWQRRAEAADDAWPEENDFQRAVADWNESIRLAIEAKRVFGRRIVYVSYDRVFGRRKWAVWREIMRNLDLDPQLTIQARRFLTKAAVRAKPKSDVPVRSPRLRGRSSRLRHILEADVRRALTCRENPVHEYEPEATGCLCTSTPMSLAHWAVALASGKHFSTA